MDIQPLDIVIYIINIVVLFLLLRVILYKPVSKFLHARTERIQKQLDDAAAERGEADALKASYEEKLSEAKKDAQQLLLTETQKANSAAAEIINSAHGQAEQLLSDARERAEEERQDAITRLEQQIADMAIALAGEILQREVSKEDNEKVIDSFFSRAG